MIFWLACNWILIINLKLSTSKILITKRLSNWLTNQLIMELWWKETNYLIMECYYFIIFCKSLLTSLREKLEIIRKLLIVKNDSLINSNELESLFYLVFFALSLSFVLLMIEFLYFTISKIQYRHAERRIQFLRKNQIFMWLNNSIFKNNSWK